MKGRWVKINYENICEFILSIARARHYYIYVDFIDTNKLVFSTSKGDEGTFDYKCGDNYLNYGFGLEDLSSLEPIEREEEITLKLSGYYFDRELVKLDNEECEGDLLIEAVGDSKSKVKLSRKIKDSCDYKIRIINYGKY